MREDLKKKLQRARSHRPDNKKLLKKLAKKNPRRVDSQFHQFHDEVFQEINCVECANCCKTTSPIFRPRDIDRMATYLRMKPSDFTEKYLKIDEDGNYVLRFAPCPFLDEDNYCTVYDHRPAACREYPHTNRKRMQQIFDLTLKNAEVCPAVSDILWRMSND